MTRLTVALLVFGLFAPTVFAQCVEVASFEQAQHRLRTFSGWLEMVKRAEMDHKNNKGRYGDLAALRKAHLLPSLIFESGSSAAPKGRSQANFVPKSTSFQVIVSADGQHFTAAIRDDCVSVSADDTGVGGVRMMPIIIRDFQDSPEGLIFAR